MIYIIRWYHRSSYHHMIWYDRYDMIDGYDDIIWYHIWYIISSIYHHLRSHIYRLYMIIYDGDIGWYIYDIMISVISYEMIASISYPHLYIIRSIDIIYIHDIIIHIWGWYRRWYHIDHHIITPWYINDRRSICDDMISPIWYMIWTIYDDMMMIWYDIWWYDDMMMIWSIWWCDDQYDRYQIWYHDMTYDDPLQESLRFGPLSALLRSPLRNAHSRPRPGPIA